MKNWSLSLYYLSCALLVSCGANEASIEDLKQALTSQEEQINCTTSPVLKDTLANSEVSDGQTVIGFGNYAYIGTASGNVSNPASPGFLNSLDMGGQSWAVAIKGNYLFVGSTTDGLYVIDKSNPSSINVVNTTLA